MTTRFNLLNLEKGLLVVLMTIRIADLQKCGSTCSFAEENNFFVAASTANKDLFRQNPWTYKGWCNACICFGLKHRARG